MQNYNTSKKGYNHKLKSKYITARKTYDEQRLHEILHNNDGGKGMDMNMKGMKKANTLYSTVKDTHKDHH
ncbi:MAG: hypothetical protein ABIN48_05090 [Ginsengibacter sp.]